MPWDVSGGLFLIPCCFSFEIHEKQLFDKAAIEKYIITCRIQNPDIPRAARVGAAHGGAAGRSRAGRDADGTVRPGDNRPSYPQSIEEKCPERPPRSTNKRNPM